MVDWTARPDGLRVSTPKDRPSDRAAGVALGEGNGFGPLSSGTGVYSVFSALKKEFEEQVEPSDIAVCCAKDGFQCALKASAHLKLRPSSPQPSSLSEPREILHRPP